MTENRSGYKYSPLGWIPEEWEITQLEQVCIPKGLIRGPFGSALKKEFLKASGYKVYEQRNAIYSGYTLGDYCIDEKKYQELKRFAIKSDDFIVSCSGTIGRIYQLPNHAPIGVINQALLIIRINPNNCSHAYFYQQFIWDKFQARIIDNTQGGAMQNLVGMDIFKKTELFNPPLPEQKAIAKVLSTWDKAIDNVKLLIDNLELRKKWLMQQLLTGKKRLPGFSGEWKEYHLGSLGDTYTGLTGKSKDDFGHGKPYIPYLNIFTNSKIDTKNFDYVEINDSETQNQVKYGDILFTVSSETQDEVGMASVMLDKIDEVYLNSFCFGFRLNNFDTMLPEFGSYYFRAYSFREKIYKLSQGAIRYNLSKNNMMKLNINLPPIDEQIAIANILKKANKEIDLQKQKLETLKEQKKGLMQVLLTGKKRMIQI